MKFHLLCALLLFLSSCSNKVSSDNCGDGILDLDEECDGQQIGAGDCSSFGYHSGTPTCNSDCTLSAAGCEFSCGDGILQTEFSEECEGLELNGATCESLGYYGGALACSADCTYDTTQCSQAGICGDGEVNGETEECDTENLGGSSCYSEKYLRGDLTCSEECALVADQCFISRTWTGGDISLSRKVALDGEGNLILLATTYFGNYDGLLIKFGPDGSEIWTKTITSDGTESHIEMFSDMAIDPEGNIYVAGQSDSDSINGVPGLGFQDALLIKYSPEGDLIWTQRYGSNRDDSITAMTLFTSVLGDTTALFVAGFTRGDWINGGGLTPLGNQDIWFAEVDPTTGLFIPDRLVHMGSDGYESPDSIVATGFNKIVISGETDSDFGGCTDNASSNVFVLRYNYLSSTEPPNTMPLHEQRRRNSPPRTAERWRAPYRTDKGKPF